MGVISDVAGAGESSLYDGWVGQRVYQREQVSVQERLLLQEGRPDFVGHTSLVVSLVVLKVPVYLIIVNGFLVEV